MSATPSMPKLERDYKQRPRRAQDLPEARRGFARWVADHGDEWYRSVFDGGNELADAVHCGQLAQNIATAPACWVTADMCALLDAASRTYEPTPDAQPLSPYGVTFFDTPLGLTDTDLGPLSLSGFTWDTQTCYPITGEWLALGAPFPPHGFSADLLTAAAPNRRSLRQLLQVVQSFWVLAGQRLTVTTTLRPDRATRRRCARLAIPGEVQVVDLRRLSHTSTQGSGSGVDWSHRWMVDGHWRNHYYPSEDTHRQMWIAPHVKGPEDKPLVLQDRLYRWKR